MTGFPVRRHDVPTVTASQMTEVDRLATEVYHLDLIQMMENAGSALARVVLSSRPDGPVTVLAGGGGNGGGAMVAARRLVGFGLTVDVVVDRPANSLRGAAAKQASILTAGGSELSNQPRVSQPALIIDGLIGYGLGGPVRERSAEMIRWANGTGAPLISLDIPSGLDATTGESSGVHISPDFTVTVALPKSGMRHPDWPGRSLLADIGIPPALYRDHFGIEIGDLFGDGDLVDITGSALLPPGSDDHPPVDARGPS